MSAFTEIVDWANSDDAQHWGFVPITEPESALLVERGETIDISLLQSMARGRQALVYDHPTGGAASLRWVTGLPHHVLFP